MSKIEVADNKESMTAIEWKTDKETSESPVTCEESELRHTNMYPG